MSRLFVLFISSLLGLTACGPDVEDDRPGQPVKRRQEAFKLMLRMSEPIGQMLRDDGYDAERYAQLVARLEETRDAPWAYFAPGSDYPPSKSRPEVWSKPDKFAAEQRRFAAAIDALRVADTQEAAQSAYDELRASCKSCHNGFRR
jgi:cytochrome c556